MVILVLVRRDVAMLTTTIESARVTARIRVQVRVGIVCLTSVESVFCQRQPRTNRAAS